MQQNVFLYTRFSPTSVQAHGGVRRCQQIVELLSRAGLSLANDPRSAEVTISAPTLRTRIDGARTLLETVPGGRWLWTTLRLALRARRLGSELDLLPRGSTVLWENTLDHFVPAVAGRRGHRVIAMPPNLESLVMAADGTPRAGELEPELSALSRADEVFCISEEEAWLLRTAGIRNASCLPYYPPAAACEELARIRSARQARPPGGRWLMLGTAGNHPTRVGMTEGLRWLAQVALERELGLDVAGFGTESLRAGFAPPSFVFHGAVSDDRLSELLASCRGMIIHHAASSGALTRLVECGIAGIPVVANADATKGQNVAGVSSYRDYDELRHRLADDLLPPPVPDRPRDAERRFVDAILGRPPAGVPSGLTFPRSPPAR